MPKPLSNCRSGSSPGNEQASERTTRENSPSRRKCDGALQGCMPRAHTNSPVNAKTETGLLCSAKTQSPSSSGWEVARRDSQRQLKPWRQGCSKPSPHHAHETKRNEMKLVPCRHGRESIPRLVPSRTPRERWRVKNGGQPYPPALQGGLGV